jgi:hypothetical protein
MSARRWPIYTMEVGAWFQDVSLPKGFRQIVHRYEERTGKKFSVTRWDKKDPSSPRVVRRVL